VLLCLIWNVFHSGGYRSLLAAVVLIVATCLAGSSTHNRGASYWVVATIVGLLGVAIDWTLVLAASKGAYLAFALLTILFGVIAWSAMPHQDDNRRDASSSALG
jgi:hypothetical protein